MGMQGAGGVGLTNNNPFGSNVSGRTRLCCSALSPQKWQAQGINVKTGQPVLVTVEIQRDGSFRIVRWPSPAAIIQSIRARSGRCWMSAAFLNLPPDFDRGSAVVDFSFRVL